MYWTILMYKTWEINMPKIVWNTTIEHLTHESNYDLFEYKSKQLNWDSNCNIQNGCIWYLIDALLTMKWGV